MSANEFVGDPSGPSKKVSALTLLEHRGVEAQSGWKRELIFHEDLAVLALRDCMRSVTACAP